MILAFWAILIRYLPEVVEKAENEFGVNMYAVGVGNYNETELRIITHNHTKRIFKLESFDDLTQVIASLENDVHDSELSLTR